MGAYDLQHDANGPYYWIGGKEGGKKSYVSPVAMGTGTKPEDTTGIFRQRPQWNASSGKWETPIDWGNVLNVGVAGGLGAGVLSAAGLFGGAAAPGSSAAASTSGAGASAAAPGYVGADVLGTAASASPAGLASTTIGTGMVPGVAGGTGITTGGGSMSILSNVLGKVKGLSQVFGGASKDQATSKALQARNQLDWERLNLAAPGIKAQSALGAAMAQNYKPRTLNWNGPGSGLRGETPSYSGGSTAALSDAMKDPILMKLMEDVKNGRGGVPNPYGPGGAGHESTLDKILGGTAFGTSVLGALR